MKKFSKDDTPPSSDGALPAIGLSKSQSTSRVLMPQILSGRVSVNFFLPQNPKMLFILRNRQIPQEEDI
jgi:hypothetical protein